jgi:hypothetical protein
MKQAFPVIDNKNTSAHYECTDPGMTLRDYFAAKAMQGLVAAGNLHRPTIAKTAYDQADEMMKAREGA